MNNINYAHTHTDRIKIIKNSKNPAELIERTKWVMEKSQSDILCDEKDHEEIFKVIFAKYRTMTTFFTVLEKETLPIILKRYRKKINLCIEE